MDNDHSMAIRAAWLAYVGNYTQEQIAERLGVSRVKVHRLIAQALADGAVKFFVEGVPVECMALEAGLSQRFGLRRCTVVPGMQPPAVADAAASNGAEIPALAVAGARALARELESGAPPVIGIGHGRTLAALVERLPRLQQPQARFVSLLGSLTRRSAANPFDVIARLAERTGGECYYLPVPFIADSVADAQVLRAQKGVQQILAQVRECRLCVVGIGELGEHTHLIRSDSVTPQELAQLRADGAVGELAGRFVGADGRLVQDEMNQRAVGADLDDLRGREVLAVSGGLYKADAIRAVLRTGVITALITDEPTAAAILAG